jgi:hypothetical protein
MKSTILSFSFILCAIFCNAQNGDIYLISSPDKNIQVKCNPGQAIYSIKYKGETVLLDSRMGNALFDLKKMKIPTSGKVEVDLKKNDGFVAVFE